MKYTFKMDPVSGKPAEAKGHNNRAPGLLRVFITDTREKTGKKMADIKKDPVFQKMVSDYMTKPVEELLFRFNGNLGKDKPGILIQDKINKFQPATANEIEIIVWADAVAVPENLAPAAPEAVVAQ
jgi:hypothetical protein